MLELINLLYLLIINSSFSLISLLHKLQDQGNETLMDFLHQQFEQLIDFNFLKLKRKLNTLIFF